MKLTAKNYFSREANLYYMSNSQYKSFLYCEEGTMEELHGRWPTKKIMREHPELFNKDCFIQGKYVDAWNNRQLAKFKRETPELYQKPKKGQLKKEMYKKFKICDEVIDVIKKDSFMKEILTGKKQVIFTAEMFGIPWKICIDCYDTKKRQITDMKIIESLSKKFYGTDRDGNRRYQGVFEYWGYLTQIAIYAEIERLRNKRISGDYFDPYLAVVTKEKIKDKAVICFESLIESKEIIIARELAYVENHIERIKAVKSGKETPNRCNTCEYCRSTKKLTGTTHYSEFEY